MDPIETLVDEHELILYHSPQKASSYHSLSFDPPEEERM
jgi:hypothetical protein